MIVINQNKKFNNYSVSQLKWSLRIFMVLQIVQTLLTIGTFAYFSLVKDSFRFSFLFMTLFFTFIYLGFYRKKYDDFLLFVMENLNPNRAKEALDYLSPTYSRGVLNGEVYYKIEMIRLVFLTGDFREAQEYLDDIDIVQYRKKLNFRGLTDLIFYDFLTQLHTRGITDTSFYIEILSSLELKNEVQKKYVNKYISYINFIDKVVNQKDKCENFEHLILPTNLDKLTIGFYVALNHFNQNNTEAAKACFTQIADENPDLFYVREAKKYLEELS